MIWVGMLDEPWAVTASDGLCSAGPSSRCCKFFQVIQAVMKHLP